ncbi:MAG: AMP-binding protein [Desulfarculaceae bacterium]|jgi:malonyl-CoA/methylmalonyl-CoA synthetase
MNLARKLLDKPKEELWKKAITFDKETITYNDLTGNVNRVAQLLVNMGMVKGDRVAVQLSKSLETIYFHLGCCHLGCISIPLNDGYKAPEVEYLLSNSGSKLFVTDAANYLKSQDVLGRMAGLKVLTIDQKFPGAAYYPQSLESIATELSMDYPTGPDDPAMICYTSGTTGLPKGAVLTQRNLVENVEDLSRVWQMSHRDILLHTLPLFHAHGLLVSLYVALQAGAETIMHAKFVPEEVWRTIKDSACTVFMGVPTLYHRLLNSWHKMEYKPDISSMRLFTSGSAPLSEKLFQNFKSAIGHTILERYGMTETIIVTSNPIEEDARIGGSVGYPLPRVSIKVVDAKDREVAPGEVGEVCIKGGNVFQGYWQNPDKTKESFSGDWFRSGDLGFQDPHDDMRLYLVGRLKEMIISGGYNVYPKEVENLLESHQAVSEAAVFSLADEDFGERVVAAVVLKPQTKLEAQDLQDFCKQSLASYKCPKQVFYLESLPKNAMGKVLKGELKDKFS